MHSSEPAQPPGNCLQELEPRGTKNKATRVHWPEPGCENGNLAYCRAGTPARRVPGRPHTLVCRAFDQPARLAEDVFRNLPRVAQSEGRHSQAGDCAPTQGSEGPSVLRWLFGPCGLCFTSRLQSQAPIAVCKTLGRGLERKETVTKLLLILCKCNKMGSALERNQVPLVDVSL